MSRIIPITDLYRYYASLNSHSTAQQTLECREFLRDPKRLIDLFLKSLSDFEQYHNIEGFGSSPRKSLDQNNRRHRVVARLRNSETNRVPEKDRDYVFRYVNREINPWRTTRSKFSDGRSASSSGLGGVDYLGRTMNGIQRPVLGEIKAESDKTAFYAFVQLLDYLSKFATRNQVDRMNRFQKFGGPVAYLPRFDLHILLADFNDRGTKHETIGVTHDLANSFKEGLKASGRGGLVGHLYCLEMDVENYSGVLKLTWKVHDLEVESGEQAGAHGEIPDSHALQRNPNDLRA